MYTVDNLYEEFNLVFTKKISKNNGYIPVKP